MVAAGAASGWSDLPIGVYRVPATNVIRSGSPAAIGAGIAKVLFGVVRSYRHAGMAQ